MKRILTRRHPQPGEGQVEGGAEPRPRAAKAMEDVLSLDAASKNLPASGERNANTANDGTGEALPDPVNTSVRGSERPYKPQKVKSVRCREGVGGGRSTADGRARQHGRREGPLLRVRVRMRVSAGECR
jgi:hypothetical protein